MKEFQKILKRGNEVQNRFALEYLFDYGRKNMLDDRFFNYLQDTIKGRDDSNSIISNNFQLGALDIARETAKLETKELFEYIYSDVKELKKQERSR